MEAPRRVRHLVLAARPHAPLELEQLRREPREIRELHPPGREECEEGEVVVRGRLVGRPHVDCALLPPHFLDPTPAPSVGNDDLHAEALKEFSEARPGRFRRERRARLAHGVDDDPALAIDRSHRRRVGVLPAARRVDEAHGLDAPPERKVRHAARDDSRS